MMSDSGGLTESEFDPISEVSGPGEEDEEEKTIKKKNKKIESEEEDSGDSSVVKHRKSSKTFPNLVKGLQYAHQLLKESNLPEFKKKISLDKRFRNVRGLQVIKSVELGLSGDDFVLPWDVNEKVSPSALVELIFDLIQRCKKLTVPASWNDLKSTLEKEEKLSVKSTLHLGYLFVYNDGEVDERVIAEAEKILSKIINTQHARQLDRLLHVKDLLDAQLGVTQTTVANASRALEKFRKFSEDWQF
ncbi:hypothetical protein L596_030687 [Steinernema carpocapsae]|uniref:Uncharacterized protein n=1 Tax=Steinernema carpocapsae TaxID=34508 RepID=A0A4U5LQ57_STECR|nr:hypothetical protein L596_030680 [Steinernema carpocapsae]TKR58064.1 hypothetical protein L596_030687 [Steinernema carpocapsae]